MNSTAEVMHKPERDDPATDATAAAAGLAAADLAAAAAGPAPRLSAAIQSGAAHVRI